MLSRRIFVGGMISAFSPPRVAIAQQKCTSQGRFSNAAVAEFMKDGRRIKLRSPLTYVSKCGKVWTAPLGTISDGASIPAFLWRLVGTPLVGLYRDAAIVHDYYCAVRIEPFSAVHEMFYEAMLASGVSKFDAAKFYLGVKIGGPSWDELTIANNLLAIQGTGSHNVSGTAVSNGSGSRPRIAGFKLPQPVDAHQVQTQAARSVITNDLRAQQELASLLRTLPSQDIALASIETLDRGAARYFSAMEETRMAAARQRVDDQAAAAHRVMTPDQIDMVRQTDMMAAPAATDVPR